MLTSRWMAEVEKGSSFEFLRCVISALKALFWSEFEHLFKCDFHEQDTAHEYVLVYHI